MSKLEKAIRRASQEHARVKPDRDAREPVQDTYADDTESRLTPVLYRLQAACAHAPRASTLEKHRIIHPGFPERALTSYKMLRTRVLQQYDANDWKTLAVTAPNDGAGKTVTAVNLAITLASHGDHDIFLVDLDLRDPSIADCFGLPEEMAGIKAYLDGDADLADILWNVGVENLAVLANRDQLTDSSDRITSKPMRNLIRTFRRAAPKPITIFDLPPVLTTDDAVAISPHVDGMLMVASERETERDGLYHALDLLRSANILGVVLNKSGQS